MILINDGYGKIFLLLLAIGIIFLAASGKGLAVWAALTGKNVAPVSSAAPMTGTTPTQNINPANPTDLRVPWNNLAGDGYKKK